jgi:hypothetical protein
MKLFLIALVFCVAAVSTVFAQTNPYPHMSLGVEYGLPVGDAASVYGTVLGASAKAEFPVAKSAFNITLTAGLSDYLVKLDYQGTLKNATYVPLELGGKYFFSRIGYVEGDLGASINVNSNYSAARTAFIYAPVIGVSAPTNKHKATIDMGLRYEGRAETGGTVSQVALRLAYRFGI